MPDYRPATQMFALVRRLEETHAGALPINQLAEELGVHRRTVIRWLQVLESELVDDTGTPLVRKEMRRREAWAVLTRATTALTANIFQYAAAVAATEHLSAGTGSVLSDSAEYVVDRAEEGLSATWKAHAPRVRQAFHYVPFAPKDHRTSEETLDKVVRSVLLRRPLHVGYTSFSGEITERRLEPWSLVMYRDGFYVLAPVGDALHLFAVERMDEARLDSHDVFAVPQDFDPADEFERNLGLWRTAATAERVVLAFDATAEPVLRARRWPGFQSLEPASDGRLHLTLEVPVTPEIKAWLMSWGAMAEVLEPAALRAEVLGEIQDQLKRYRG